MASNSGNSNISHNSLNHLYLWIKGNKQEIKENYIIKAKNQLSFKDLAFEAFNNSLEFPKFHGI